MNTDVQWDEALTRRGIVLYRYMPLPGETYWKLVRGEYLREKEHTFVDVLDDFGWRKAGVPVRFWWADGEQIKRTEDKRGERWAVDFPMFNAGKSYGVEIHDVLHSDSVWGLGLGSPERPDWKEHVSWRFVFQMTTAAPAAPTDPPPAKEEEVTLYFDGLHLKARLADGRVKTVVTEG